MAEDDTKQLIKRFSELAERADRTGVICESRFLSLAEQAVLNTLRLPVPFFTCGGYPEAERRTAVFGLDEQAAGESGYSSPIVCVRISPASARFADELTHRDFLGALMALGITRDVLGDIIVSDNSGYLFCLDSIADYVIDSLSEVKRTTVVCAYSDPPAAAAGEAEPVSLVVPSERIDAVISSVYRLPREDAKLTVEKGLVYIDGRLVLKGGASLPPNSRVTVRGRGRFTYLGPERETKKGKLRVLVIRSQ